MTHPHPLNPEYPYAASNAGAPSAESVSVCPGPAGPRGCPGPAGPQGSQPPLSDAVDSTARDTAASSLAVNTVYQRTRTPLLRDTVLYVRAEGNDARDGLSEATARRTLAGAFTLLDDIDPRGFRVCVDVGPGNFAGRDVSFPAYNQLNLFIQGAGTDRTELTGNFTVYTPVSVAGLALLGQMRIMGCYARVTAYSGTHVLRCKGSESNPISHLYVHDGTLDLTSVRIELEGSMEIGVDGGRGHVICGGATVFQALENVSFRDAFLTSSRGGTIALYRATFEGEATGRRYIVHEGGQISGNRGNNDLTALLGDQPGEVLANGQAGIAGMAQAICHVNAAGATDAAFNIASCVRTDAGTYAVTFIRPAARAAYAVLPVSEQADSSAWSVSVSNKTTSGLTFVTRHNGAPTDSAFSFSCCW